MAVRTISTSIKLDGEQEFKKQMNSVNSELKNLKSELSLATAEFKGQANSMEALTAKGRLLQQQYDQQKAKVAALEKAVQEVGLTLSALPEIDDLHVILAPDTVCPYKPGLDVYKRQYLTRIL